MAVINQESGAEAVERYFPNPAISSVNFAEVVTKLTEKGLTEEIIRAILQGLFLDIVSFDSESAYETGLLRISTKNLGLSLGDRACLNLAQQLGVPAITADKIWARVQAGPEVRLIR